MSEKLEKIKQLIGTFPPETLVADSHERVYAAFKGTNIIIAVKSSKFLKVVRQQAKANDLRLNKGELQDVVDDIESSYFEDEKTLIVPSVRGALCQNGAVVYDLAQDDGTVVKLSGGAPELIPNSEAVDCDKFRQPESMLPMVTPIFTERWKLELCKLLPYINTDQSSFVILLGYLTYLITHPKSKGVPYPILVIQGQQGSGKSFFCNNVIRALIDPNASASLRLPKRDQDLAIQLENTFLAVYDNLRGFNKDFSDLFAQVATKTSFSIRQHNSYDELVSKELHAPLVFNGIHNFIKESDLAERCFRVVLQVMKPENRKTETQLKEDFAVIQPYVLGALFTLAAKAMEVVKTCESKHPARIMDFSLWLAAIEKVYGFTEGQLQKAYLSNVKATMASGTEDDSLTLGLQKLLLLQPNKVWKGSATELLNELKEHDSPYHLPKGAGALSQRLKGQISSLAANSIYLQFGRDKDRYIIVSAMKLTS
jgi:hypothetical protein